MARVRTEEGCSVLTDFDPKKKREPGGPEDYVRLALLVIAMPGGDQEDLRQWWKDETLRRRKYGVTGEYEQRLIAACREKAATLPQRKPE